MNQGQHIMTGVRAASRRYYGSPRKGQGRRLGHHMRQIARNMRLAVEGLAEAASKMNEVFQKFRASQEQQ